MAPIYFEGNNLALLLEQQKAHALEQQQQGVECTSCVDDGEGNFLPSALVHAIKLHKMKHQVDEHEATKDKALPLSIDAKSKSGKEEFGQSHGKMTSLQFSHMLTLQENDDNDGISEGINKDAGPLKEYHLGQNGHFSKYHRGAHSHQWAP